MTTVEHDRSGQRILAAAATALALVAAACSSADSAAESTTPAPSTVVAESNDLGAGFDELIAEVDDLVAMVPGSGPGPQAEALVKDFGDDAIPGTADHMARVATVGGFVNIIAYQQRMVDVGPVGGELLFCIGEFGPSGGGASCDLEPPRLPQADSWSTMDGPGASRNSITAFGGDDAVFAILVTDNNARIGIITARGWAYADWPSTWGLPGTITFYDSNANPGFSSRYDPR